MHHTHVDPFLWAQLQRRFGRDDNDTIRDIFDGQEYKKLVHSGFLSQANRANVSFTLNTDGVDVYRSSKYSIWPIWLQINELPPAQRSVFYTEGGIFHPLKLCDSTLYMYMYIF